MCTAAAAAAAAALTTPFVHRAYAHRCGCCEASYASRRPPSAIVWIAFIFTSKYASPLCHSSPLSYASLHCYLLSHPHNHRYNPVAYLFAVILHSTRDRRNNIIDVSIESWLGNIRLNKPAIQQVISIGEPS
jgi:hypothetical protein